MTEGAIVTEPRDFSLIVAFGTDMGNAEDAAMSFAEAAGAIGIEVEAIELNQVELGQLQSATHFVVVTSTFGEGEFPDNAPLFWEAISGETDRLEHLSFAVLALGDSSYEFFCDAGKLLDERLEALGATRLADRVDVDGLYEQPAAAWTTDVVKLLAAQQTTPAPTVVVTLPRHRTPKPAEPGAPSSRRRPPRRQSPCSPHRNPTRRSATTRSTSPDSGITYQAGDSIAVHARNDPALVDALLAELDVGPDHAVADHDQPLGVLLTDHSRDPDALAGAAGVGGRQDE